MSEKKRSRVDYNSEFKAEAVAKCLNSSVSQTSRELGVTTTTLRNWIQKLEHGENQLSSKKTYEELESENRRLKKEIGYINEINKILKKSTAIFSSKEMGGLP